MSLQIAMLACAKALTLVRSFTEQCATRSARVRDLSTHHIRPLPARFRPPQSLCVLATEMSQPGVRAAERARLARLKYATLTHDEREVSEPLRRRRYSSLPLAGV